MRYRLIKVETIYINILRAKRMKKIWFTALLSVSILGFISCKGTKNSATDAKGEPIAIGIVGPMTG